MKLLSYLGTASMLYALIVTLYLLVRRVGKNRVPLLESAVTVWPAKWAPLICIAAALVLPLDWYFNTYQPHIPEGTYSAVLYVDDRGVKFDTVDAVIKVEEAVDYIDGDPDPNYLAGQTGAGRAVYSHYVVVLSIDWPSGLTTTPYKDIERTGRSYTFEEPYLYEEDGASGVDYREVELHVPALTDEYLGLTPQDKLRSLESSLVWTSCFAVAAVFDACCCVVAVLKNRGRQKH